MPTRGTRRRVSTPSTPAPARAAVAVTPATSFEEEDREEDEEPTVATELQNKRTADTTKKTYKSRINQAIIWFSTHAPDCLTQDQKAFKLDIPWKRGLEGFFSHLCAAAVLRDKLKSAEEITEEMPEPLSVSTIVGYRSAFVDLYTTAKKEMPLSIRLELARTMDGYEKQITSLKRRGLMKISEGKRPISGSGYAMLAEKFMKRNVVRTTSSVVAGSWSTTLFGWSFFIVMWNLMSRADSVNNIMLQHMEWNGDALIITEHGGKADQKDENNYGKHIYANPLQPAICPILALAVHIFCSGHRPPNGRQQLFIGTNSKDRFSHLLTELVANLSEAEAKQLGCLPEDIGMHSERKGSSTYCLGQVGGPTPVSVFLRMGQSLGQLKDRYIFACEGADQLCGRMVCGLPYSDEEFGTLPPHFSSQHLALMTTSYWGEIVDGYDNYPESFKTIFPFLLASLLHHETFLRANLPAQHPLWSQRVFIANRHLSSLRGNTLTGIGACKVTGMKATGIPPHLAIASKVRELTEAVLSLRDMMTSLLEGLAQSLPAVISTKVSEELRQNFVINGIAPLTIRDIDVRMTEQRNEFRALIMQLMETSRGASVAATAPVSSESVEDESWWKVWNWNDGTIAHFVPPGWRFPTGITVKSLWDLWYHGDRSVGIRPLKLLKKDVEVSREDGMKYSRATIVLKFMEKIMTENNTITNVTRLTLQQSDVLFHATYKLLLRAMYTDVSDSNKLARKDEVSYGTAYKQLSMHDINGIIGKKRVRK